MRLSCSSVPQAMGRAKQSKAKHHAKPRPKAETRQWWWWWCGFFYFDELAISTYRQWASPAGLAGERADSKPEVSCQHMVVVVRTGGWVSEV